MRRAVLNEAARFAQCDFPQLGEIVGGAIEPLGETEKRHADW